MINGFHLNALPTSTHSSSALFALSINSNFFPHSSSWWHHMDRFGAAFVCSKFSSIELPTSCDFFPQQINESYLTCTTNKYLRTRNKMECSLTTFATDIYIYALALSFSHFTVRFISIFYFHVEMAVKRPHGSICHAFGCDNWSSHDKMVCDSKTKTHRHTAKHMKYFNFSPNAFRSDCVCDA